MHDPYRKVFCFASHVAEAPGAAVTVDCVVNLACLVTEIRGLVMERTGRGVASVQVGVIVYSELLRFYR